MKEHLQQAKHNEDFHDCICDKFPDRFFDWKITVLFYSALHHLQALAASKGIDIGATHTEIEKNVRPDKHGCMQISRGAWGDYNGLRQYSNTARYSGITDFETYEKLKKADYHMAKQHLENFKKYCNSKMPVQENKEPVAVAQATTGSAAA